MKAVRVCFKAPALLLGIVSLVLVLVPFHAFLTVWLSSLIGHYTLLRLWKEILLVVLFVGMVYLCIKEPRLRWKIISYKLSWLIAAYVLVQLLWGLVALGLHHVSAKALGYGWVVDTRFLIFFVVAWIFTLHWRKFVHRWPPLVFWPLAVVIVFGLLQYFVLPYNVLTHVGYSASTIFPYETINHNIHHLRIMSSLRGANPLGAYLVVGLSLVAVFWRRHKRAWWLVALFTAGLVVLYLSFSRSAWIGLALALAIIVWASLLDKRTRGLAGSIVIILAAVAVAFLLALRHNATFQDVVLHTNSHSAIAATSDAGHATALENGARDLLREPLGEGPGTAGPASVYNTRRPARDAENYFLQIGQETGWIGLLLFAAINVVVGRALWRRRHQSLALGLLASLVGITAVNMFLPAWTDDTLAYLWWGLAGMAIAVDLTEKDG